MVTWEALTEWELDFMESIETRYLKSKGGKGADKLSEKQIDVLERIYRKQDEMVIIRDSPIDY